MNTAKEARPNKVCPVLLRTTGRGLIIVAFRHPLAGFQLVKGTIEPGETEEGAALRELFEESGIDSAKVVRHLGIWNSGFEGQVWSFQLCEANGLPDEWMHHTRDGGGLYFAFFWQPLDEDPDSNWHPIYRCALIYIRSVVEPASE